jgi:hypothetical protein
MMNRGGEGKEMGEEGSEGCSDTHCWLLRVMAIFSMLFTVGRLSGNDRSSS